MANGNDAVLAAIHELGERFQSLERRFQSLEERFQSMEGRFERLGQRMEARGGDLRHELMRTRTDILAGIDRLQATFSEIKENLAATERAGGPSFAASARTWGRSTGKS